MQMQITEAQRHRFILTHLILRNNKQIIHTAYMKHVDKETYKNLYNNSMLMTLFHNLNFYLSNGQKLAKKSK